MRVRIYPRIQICALAACLLVAGASPGEAGCQTGVPEWSLRPEVRIGAVDGPEALDVIGAIVVSPRSGNVYFTDRSQHISAYTPDGQRTGQFGGRGAGPGEFEGLGALYWADSLIVALDAALSRRVTWFTERGEVVRTGTIAVPRSTVSGVLIAPLGRHGFLAGSRRSIPDGNLLRTEETLLVVDGDAERTLDQIRNAPVVAALGSGQMIMLPAMWESRVAVHPYGTGLVIVHQDPPSDGGETIFRVRSLASDGSERFARSYRYTPVALPQDYVDRNINIQRGLMLRLGVSAREVENVARANLPSFQPPVTEVRIAVDGSIWLQRGNRDEEMIWWWVLDSRGNLVGRLHLPALLKIRHIEGDLVWGIDRDELDVNHVVSYRIVR